MGHCTSPSCLELAALEDGPIDSGKATLPLSVQQGALEAALLVHKSQAKGLHLEVGDVAELVECLPSIYKALGSILSTVWGSGTKHVMSGGNLPHSGMAALRARCTPSSPDCTEHAPTVCGH